MHFRRYVQTLAILLAAGAAQLATAQITWNLTSTSNIGGFSTSVTGSPTVVATPFGNGLRFDGNDGVIVNTNPLAGATAYTMEMLLRPDANPSPTEDQPRIFHIEATMPSGSRTMLEGRVNGNLWYLDGFLRAPRASNPSIIDSLTLTDPAKTFPVNRWYSYAIWYNGSTLKVYLNGVEQLSGAIAITSIAPGVTSIGMRQNQVNFFKGDVPVVRFTPSAIPVSALMSNRIPGDFNGDFYDAGGGIDDRDVAVWQTQFGTAGPFPNFGNNADSDNDGDVDGADFLFLQLRLGSTNPIPTQSVPEPSALASTLIAAVISAAAYRRRR